MKIDLNELGRALYKLNYDKENFTYVDDDKIILDKLKEWVSDLPILLVDNTYTLNFLNDFDNLFFSDLNELSFLSLSLHKVSYSITFSTFSVSLNLFFSEFITNSGFSLNNFISNNILSPKIFYSIIIMILLFFKVNH